MCLPSLHMFHNYCEGRGQAGELFSFLQEERKKVDIEEAKYQAQKRKEAIERAKTLQYYQTDRVKTFHVRTV